MNANTIITLALSAYLVVSGLVMLIKGKMMRGDYSKYTDKSVKTFARVMGACFTISGILFVPYWVIGYLNNNMKKITTPRLIILAAIFAIIIISLILRPIILKKHTSGAKAVYSKSTDEDDV